MVEVADIFRRYGQAYRQANRLPRRKLKAMGAIEQCRTAKLGGHVDKCNSCDYMRISYNSCRNRHCPKCQSLAKEKWLMSRQKELLPVEYFHVVFTVPVELNHLALRNQREFYNILFKSAAQTLLELGKDPRYLGAETGFISILHTWGQNLLDHPHLHCVVPGGGLSLNGKKWISAREGFFLPVKVMSSLFRGKFLSYLKEACKKGKITFPSKQEQSIEQALLWDKLYRCKWVVYCKKPFGSPEQVLQYLGRYTHRVAISNNRIISLEDNKVSFRWRDYRDNNKNKVMSIEPFEFIRRFLLHILPDNFMKIRYFGILSNSNRAKKLKKCRELLNTGADALLLPLPEEWAELLFFLTGLDLRVCPLCKKGKMVKENTIAVPLTDTS